MSFQNSDTKTLLEIIKSRRDVRGNRFLSREIEEEKLHLILKSATMAPSVGYCQPWRFIVIKNQQIKNDIYNNFQSENQKAKEQFKDSKLYQNLKLEGIKEAPINIAVLLPYFADEFTKNLYNDSTSYSLLELIRYTYSCKNCSPIIKCPSIFEYIIICHSYWYSSAIFIIIKYRHTPR